MSKAQNSRAEGRVELGRYIVADPAICHGKPTESLSGITRFVTLIPDMRRTE
jgi:uncharacterized protein (DUF433 family)